MSFDSETKIEAMKKAAFFCCVCRKSSISVEVHHIIPLNERPDLLMEETNVKVICNECHIKIHKSTKKEYLQYLKKKLKCQTEKI